MNEDKKIETTEIPETQQPLQTIIGSMEYEQRLEPSTGKGITQTQSKLSNKNLIRLVILVVLNIFTIVFPILTMIDLGIAAKNGQSGTEFIALLLIPVFLAGILVAIVDIFVLVKYLRTSKPKKTVKAICIIVILLASAYVLIPGSSLLIGIYKSQQVFNKWDKEVESKKKLYSDAKPNEAVLANIFKEYDTSKIATQINLDVDAEQATAEKDTYANFHQKASGSLMQVETDLFDKVLQPSGYMRWGKDQQVYYISGNSSAVGKGYVVMQYRKNNEVIMVQYMFDTWYSCPETYTCSNTSSNKPTDKIYPIVGYKDIPVVSFDVRYSPNPNNYALQFDSEYY